MVEATEEQRRERLRIRREKEGARRRKKTTTRGKEKVVRNRRPRETAPSHFQRLKRGDENEGEKSKTGERCR